MSCLAGRCVWTEQGGWVGEVGGLCGGVCRTQQKQPPGHDTGCVLGAKAAVGQGRGAGQLPWQGSNCKLSRKHAPACEGVITRVTDRTPFLRRAGVVHTC